MNQHMDVIRHHTPCKQFVRFLVLEQQCIFRQLRNSRVAQMTFTNSAIKILLQLRAFLAVIFNLQQMFPLTAARFRHGIGKAERDELDETGKITMRQVTAFMPAEKTERLLFIR